MKTSTVSTIRFYQAVAYIIMWFISCGDILEFFSESMDISFMNSISEYEVVLQ